MIFPQKKTCPGAKIPQGSRLFLLFGAPTGRTHKLQLLLRYGLDLVRRTGVSPNLPYFRLCGSSGWASVKVRGLGRPAII